MRGMPDVTPGRGSSHLLPCTHAARPAARADLTWALGQASTSAAIGTLFVPLPEPLQPSDLGFPLGKSPPPPTPPAPVPVGAAPQSLFTKAAFSSLQTHAHFFQ